MKVLIAEDDLTSRVLLTVMLESWGFDVTVTKDGQEAWEALQGEDRRESGYRYDDRPAPSHGGRSWYKCR